MARWTLPKFKRKDVQKDVTAGLVLGLVSVPDGLALGLLAGISPLAGLYGYLIGTMAGALSTSSVLMSVQATGAMAVLLSDVPQVAVGVPNAANALVTLTVLTGLIMLTLGLLRAGTLVRFVPNAVLTGFVNAVAINIVLGQLGGFTGFASDASNRLLQLVDTFANVALFDWPSVAIGAATVALILILERTPIGQLGLFLAIVVTSAIVVLFSMDSVAQLSDLAAVPSSLPTPVLPSAAQVFALLVPAVALAFVGLIQGAAISQSVPNPDGTFPNVSGDFRGQGIANIASGIFQGMPVGGSMSGTAIVAAAGARSRLANLIAGVVIGAVILLLGAQAGYIAMPALAALLILVGVRTFKLDQILMVWRTGATQAAVMTTTFLLTLIVPLQFAVLAGVGISVIMFVARQSEKVTVLRWVQRDGDRFPREVPPPTILPAGEIVVLTAYGSLFFASAAVFQRQLPQVTIASSGTVVVLRLRGKEDLGSTFIQVVTRYHTELRGAGSELVLAGVHRRVLAQLSKTGAIRQLGRKNVFTATRSVGQSLERALARAEELQTDNPQG